MSDAYIHLGWDAVVPLSSVMYILDLDTATRQPATREFLNAAVRENRLFEIAPDMPRSAVVCLEKGKTVVYISKLSPAAIKGRMEKL